MPKTKIGAFLKTRKSNQNEAAKLLGISVTAFSMKATGRNQFKQNEIKKLADEY